MDILGFFVRWFGFRRLDHARSDFVDMVSHQLRGPLGAIRASASLLAEGGYGELPPDAQKTVQQIESSATRLLSLAETFLHMSRLKVGAYESRRVPTDVRKEIDQVIAEMFLLAESKKLTLSSRIQKNVPEKICVDRESLQNVLFNLVDNAVKYTDAGSIQILCAHEPGLLRIDVQDTGDGMTEADLRSLFQKYHRGKNAHARAVDGTGMGLYVVRRLVEAADGRISVTSKGPGKGSTFTATLPVDESPSAQVG